MATSRARLYWLTYVAGFVAFLVYDHFAGQSYWVTVVIYLAAGLLFPLARRLGEAMRDDGE